MPSSLAALRYRMPSLASSEMGASATCRNEALLADERVVRAEEHPVPTDKPHDGGENLLAVEKRRCGGVEVYTLQRLPHLRHERVEGQPAAPVGADERGLREGLDEAAERLRRGAPLAGVGMPHRLGCVRENGHTGGYGRLHHGRHHLPVAQVEALRVRMKLADACQSRRRRSAPLRRRRQAPQRGLTAQKPLSLSGKRRTASMM